MIYQISSYLHHIARSVYQRKKENDFVRKFTRDILDTSKEYYCYPTLELARKKMLNDDSFIDFIDFGAGDRSGKRKIKEIAKSSLSSEKQCRLLFNLVTKLQPHISIELGTSLGLTTSYISRACFDQQIYTIEGNPASASYAKSLFNSFNIENISVHRGVFEKELPTILSTLDHVDFAYIDGNHAYQPTLDYFTWILTKMSKKGVIVFDDIYWSQEMTKAWQTIIQHKDVTLSIDLFDVGIVFVDKDLPKENLTLRY